MTATILALLTFSTAAGFLAPQFPPWGQANWNMSQSTLTMACNASGWFNVSVAASFGITSYDWSNNKAAWAKGRPMNDQELMLEQASMTSAANPDTRVFIYANLVKALPWLTYVREKISDPAYAGWFLRFKSGGSLPNGSYHVPNCDPITGVCSEFYHDQEQTPEVPTPANPSPDGVCDGYCDCGAVPCGEYLWDHRNDTLRPWLIAQLVEPIKAANISGYFVDDFWCSDIVNGTGACTDPVQGPTEIDSHSQADMGLSDQDIADITLGWLDTMTAAQQAIVDAGGYTWSLIPGQDNADASPLMVGPDAGSCNAALRDACRRDAPWQSVPLLAGLHPGNATSPLPYLTQDLAAFLLMRGPWAWVGWGEWGMSWPAGTAWNAPNGTSVLRPVELDTDYGVPVDAQCYETEPGVTGIYVRRFTKAVATLDCGRWQATIATG